MKFLFKDEITMGTFNGFRTVGNISPEFFFPKIAMTWNFQYLTFVETFALCARIVVPNLNLIKCKCFFFIGEQWA